MKKTLVLIALLASAGIAQAHSVGRAEGGHHGASLGSTAAAVAANHASANAAQSSGFGGSYFSPDAHASLVDGFQPWPESEMRQFQKQ